MAIKLRENETIMVKKGPHPMYFWAACIWLALIVIACVPNLVQLRIPSSITIILLIGLPPVMKSYLRLKGNNYYITNLRVFTEEGILSKVTRDIPLSKINDVGYSQGILERLYDTGKIRILTGNDSGILLNEIEEPEEFMEALSKSIGQNKQAV